MIVKVVLKWLSNQGIVNDIGRLIIDSQGNYLVK